MQPVGWLDAALVLSSLRRQDNIICISCYVIEMTVKCKGKRETSNYWTGIETDRMRPPSTFSRSALTFFSCLKNALNTFYLFIFLNLF